MTPTEFKDRYGPTALVTGASSGIGKAFAEVLAARGLDLVLVARRLDRLDALAARLTAEHGVAVQTRQVDLAQPTAAQQMLDATAALDIGLVVSNAGFGLNTARFLLSCISIEKPEIVSRLRPRGNPVSASASILP